jgi:hypothetical protein
MCPCLVEVRHLVECFVANLHESLPSHIQKIMRCLAQLSLACNDHAAEAWLQWQPPMLQAMLTHLSIQRKALKEFHVASVLRDVTQIACLFLPPDTAREIAEAATSTAAVQAAGDAGQQQSQVLLMAATAAAAAVDQVLDVKGLQDDEDDDDPGRGAAGGSSSSYIWKQKMAPSASAEALNQQQQQQQQGQQRGPVQPCSPVAAPVKAIVADMFDRVLLQHGEERRQQQLPPQQLQMVMPDVVLGKLAPQLQRLGLLQQYTLLKNLCMPVSSSGIGNYSSNTTATRTKMVQGLLPASSHLPHQALVQQPYVHHSRQGLPPHMLSAHQYVSSSQSYSSSSSRNQGALSGPSAALPPAQPHPYPYPYQPQAVYAQQQQQRKQPVGLPPQPAGRWWEGLSSQPLPVAQPHLPLQQLLHDNQQQQQQQQYFPPPGSLPGSVCLQEQMGSASGSAAAVVAIAAGASAAAAAAIPTEDVAQQQQQQQQQHSSSSGSAGGAGAGAAAPAAAAPAAAISGTDELLLMSPFEAAAAMAPLANDMRSRSSCSSTVASLCTAIATSSVECSSVPSYESNKGLVNSKDSLCSSVLGSGSTGITYLSLPLAAGAALAASESGNMVSAVAGLLYPGGESRLRMTVALSVYAVCRVL